MIGRLRILAGRSWGYLREFAGHVRRRVLEPAEGAVRGHVRPDELLDVLLSGLASGGLSSALCALAEYHDRWLYGLSDAQASLCATLLTMAARLVQRYFQGGPPVKPA